ncbi:transcriptional regulator, MarR family [Gleimia coleocanis DSM 15436]|uniref:Transcriptional regulator, MarR family n=1 Tax=Gleimia coleocanis DSM 15436 TaxID=525245 RepID=C0W0K3_9ACTO|nr:MarR family transcriptional regulator [Gleimia coleocanis]EEH64062.1 transcriptional regulator, MarR family [Gleimia coleocanis DSM 15436]
MAADLEHIEFVRDRAWQVFSEVSMRLSFMRNTKIKNELHLAPAEYEALTTLYLAEDGSMRMGVLADNMCFSPSRLSYVISGLIERNLVEKSISAKDGRGYIAQITDDGRRIWEQANAMERDLFRQHFLSLLSIADQEELSRIFAPLEEHLPALRDINHRF